MVRHQQEMELYLRTREEFGEGGRYHLHIPEAEDKLKAALVSLHFDGVLDNVPVWRPDYNEIARWCADNKGKGLLLIGGCGVGKTIFAKHVLPKVIKDYYDRNVTFIPANELNDQEGVAMRKMLLAIDDIGVEGMKNDYGNKREVLANVVDAMEQRGGLLILTTNYNAEDLQNKYGHRCWDRIGKLMQVVTIQGDSLRGKATRLTATDKKRLDEQKRQYEEEKQQEEQERKNEEGRRQHAHKVQAWYEAKAAECGVSVEVWLNEYATSFEYIRGLFEREGGHLIDAWMKGRMLYDNFPDKAALDNLGRQAFGSICATA